MPAAPALEGLRIALLSDFHLYPYTQLPLIEQTVSWTNFMQPDIVVLAGDYVLSEVEAIQELAPALGKLNARYGVFAIMGNHDAAQWIGSDVVAAGLRAAGIHTLIDEAVTLGVGAGLIYLMGLDDAYWATPNPGALVYGCPAGALPILALHEPDPADDVAALGRVALQLSGHSHAGRCGLPASARRYCRPWGKSTTRPVPRGRHVALYHARIGVTGPPVRFNCPPRSPRSRSCPAPSSAHLSPSAR